MSSVSRSESIPGSKPALRSSGSVAQARFGGESQEAGGSWVTMDVADFSSKLDKATLPASERGNTIEKFWKRLRKETKETFEPILSYLPGLSDEGRLVEPMLKGAGGWRRSAQNVSVVQGSRRAKEGRYDLRVRLNADNRFEIQWKLLQGSQLKDSGEKTVSWENLPERLREQFASA